MASTAPPTGVAANDGGAEPVVRATDVHKRYHDIEVLKE